MTYKLNSDQSNETQVILGTILNEGYCLIPRHKLCKEKNEEIGDLVERINKSFGAEVVSGKGSRKVIFNKSFLERQDEKANCVKTEIELMCL